MSEQLLLWWKNLFRIKISTERPFWSRYFYTATTFSEQILFQQKYFFQKMHFFTRRYFFLESHFFRVGKTKLFIAGAFQKSYFSKHNFLEEVLFHISVSFLYYTESWTTQKIFSLNTMTKTFASKLLPQGSIKQDKLSTNAKNFRFVKF